MEMTPSFLPEGFLLLCDSLTKQDIQLIMHNNVWMNGLVSSLSSDMTPFPTSVNTKLYGDHLDAFLFSGF